MKDIVCKDPSGCKYYGYENILMIINKNCMDLSEFIASLKKY